MEYLTGVKQLTNSNSTLVYTQKNMPNLQSLFCVLIKTTQFVGMFFQNRHQNEFKNKNQRSI